MFLNKKVIVGSRHSKRGFTLTEILIVTIMIAILASLILPRFLNQNEKALATEAINTMGALRRGMMQFNEQANATWFPTGAGLGSPYDVCTNINLIADNLGVNVTDACGAGRWTFTIVDENPVNTFVITAIRAGGLGTLTLTYDKITGVLAWGGTLTFAQGAVNWPNLQ